jgi:phage-related minor tail protein
MPWQAYVVGERGPEIFVPSMAGMIVPNGGRANAGSGLPAMGGDTFITNIYDRTSANLIGALIEERKRKRLNEWMGG